ncbi:hypothetical protein FRC08_009597 [Ceratobasidium sp. 394]|nr:hypothetical protein FRC08_009597 [Ceratobasidium sp. 394]
MMRAHRERLQAEKEPSSSRLDSAARRQQALTRYFNLLKNPDATVDELQIALADAASMLEAAGKQPASAKGVQCQQGKADELGKLEFTPKWKYKKKKLGGLQLTKLELRKRLEEAEVGVEVRVEVPDSC